MDTVLYKIDGVGEAGIDSESSPGNGPYYAKLYDGSYDACGFETLDEAIDELVYLAEV